MPRRTRRTFTPEFKAQVVLALVTGQQSHAELCREHQLSPNLLTLWKNAFLERVPDLFRGDDQRSAEQARNLGRGLDGEWTPAALRRALAEGRPEVHHSDQGVPYAAGDCVRALQGVGTRVSMAAVGEPRENGFAERLMRTIKEEEVALTEYRDFADALRPLGRFLDEVYNRKRIHSSLG